MPLVFSLDIISISYYSVSGFKIQVTNFFFLPTICSCILGYYHLTHISLPYVQIILEAHLFEITEGTCKTTKTARTGGSKCGRAKPCIDMSSVFIAGLSLESLANSQCQTKVGKRTAMPFLQH